MTAVVILAILLALLLLGVPIAFALGGLGLVMLAYADISLVMVPQGLLSGVDNFVLLAVPLFLLMSTVLLKGGVGQDLFAAVQSWVGHWPGGLAVATVISCALFSAISGSSVATAATIAVVAVPEMLRRGYPPPFVYGLIAAGGTLGILIPPSIPLIVYGVVTEESIPSLFLAGVVPGLMLAGGFILFALLYGRFSKRFAPIAKADWAERRRTTLRALPTLFIAGTIFAGIYSGAFTPTESAGVGLALAVVVVMALRWVDGQPPISLKLYWEAAEEATRTTVTILLIVVCAKIFGKAVTLYLIPQSVAEAIALHVTDAGVFILVVSVVLLILGFFLEALSMLLIVVPVLFPSLRAMGIDPIWFGIYFMILIECALITPPVGLNLFVLQAVAKAKLGDVVRGVWPFIAIMLGMVVLLTLFPGLALFLPFGVF
ncbi:MAG: TRAP transporter large permease subunit [Rhodospirillales bacterium]